jgi:ascorbate-specific PTS system EIIC-type component UlaA
VIYIFGSQAHWWSLPNWLSFLNNSETQATIIIILVFGIIIWFVTKGEKKKDDDKKGLIKSFTDVLKGEENK